MRSSSGQELDPPGTGLGSRGAPVPSSQEPLGSEDVDLVGRDRRAESAPCGRHRSSSSVSGGPTARIDSRTIKCSSEVRKSWCCSPQTLHLHVQRRAQPTLGQQWPSRAQLWWSGDPVR